MWDHISHKLLVNGRWVGSGYGRWINGTFSDSPQFKLCISHELCCYKRCTDTLDPGQFKPKTIQHYQAGAEVSGYFGTSAEVSRRQFGTGTKMSRLASYSLFMCYSRTMHFYSMSAFLAMQSAVLATTIVTCIHPSVCHVRHVPVFCPD